jgi:hypothetical protein
MIEPGDLVELNKTFGQQLEICALCIVIEKSKDFPGSYVLFLVNSGVYRTVHINHFDIL